MVTGSITLCHTLIKAGAGRPVPAVHLPVVQIRGRRLFPDGFKVPALKLLDARTFRRGITYSRYAPA